MPNFNTNHGLTDGERKLGSRGGGLSKTLEIALHFVVQATTTRLGNWAKLCTWAGITRTNMQFPAEDSRARAKR